MSSDSSCLFLNKDYNTVKPVGHLRHLKKVSAITRCTLNRGYEVIFTGIKFREFPVILTILRKLVPTKIIAKLIIREICEILRRFREIRQLTKSNSREVCQIIHLKIE